MTQAAAMREGALRTEDVYAEHHDFVWRTLQRFGVPAADLEDACQEVFVIVHRRLDSFDGSAKMTTWLYGICRRVAAGQLRRAFRKREKRTERLPERVSDAPGPEHRVAARQAGAAVERILGKMSLDHRAVFVMFEIEGMGGEEIAAELSIPVGTVHSRLHKARKLFTEAARRLRGRRS